jgi:hypothetical protein
LNLRGLRLRHIRAATASYVDPQQNARRARSDTLQHSTASTFSDLTFEICTHLQRRFPNSAMRRDVVTFGNSGANWTLLRLQDHMSMARILHLSKWKLLLGSPTPHQRLANEEYAAIRKIKFRV